MKTLLVKRLESSFCIQKLLNRFRIANERMIEMFENNKVFIAPIWILISFTRKVYRMRR